MIRNSEAVPALGDLYGPSIRMHVDRIPAGVTLELLYRNGERIKVR